MTDTEASFEFIQWRASYEKQKPYEVFLPLASFDENTTKVPRSNLAFEPRAVRVQDVRGQQEHFDLDTHGFQFVRHTTTVGHLKDRTAVNEQYIPEMESFLRLHLQQEGKEARTFCFDLRVGIYPNLLAGIRG
jgi:hypothetical protein